ncbi:MAG: ribonuclease III [Lachnospiraceae bacterium]|nr:ribonuclease III [Lachnospiraceae bacterium]
MENDLLTQIIDGLGIDRKDVNAIPALTLAYLGDCIYELVIRTMLVERGITHVSDLNKAAVGFVKAAAQKDMFFAVEDILTEEEMSVFRRGRNVKSSSCPKNASVTDYHTATGFEALMGYLYLKERTERLIELIRIGMDKREG